jgi:hypothetical protein
VQKVFAFIAPDERQAALDVVRTLENSRQVEKISPDLRELVENLPVRGKKRFEV